MKEQKIEVKTTNDYEQFKFMEHNRRIKSCQVAKLVRSMQQEYLVSPIIVNEKNEIIDGQHRFKAIKKLGLPLHYIIMQGYNQLHVNLYNQSQMNWNYKDYLEHYCSRNEPEYLKLQKILEEYKISLTLGRVFTSYPSKSMEFRYPSDEVFKQGDYVLENPAADDIVEKFCSIKNFWPFTSNRSFAIAFRNVLSNPTLDWSRLKSQIEKYPYVIHKCSNVAEYMKNFQELYNFNRTKDKRVRLYQEEL